jgi:pyridoxamine 5'-phosphate oxidase
LTDPDPLRRLAEWYDEASELVEPNVMALATASPDGVPSVRIVLLKGIDPRGVQFFTNYENPRAAATIYWQPLDRAVRFEGPVERLTAEESDAYFASRPRGSRLGAWASHQGSALPSRDLLDAAFEEADARFPGDEVPRPDYWGGYRIVPLAVELWQGMPSRLHDRVHWVRDALDSPWREERLSP